MIYQIGAAERSRYLSVRRDQVLRREKEGGMGEGKCDLNIYSNKIYLL